jgi:hypothetical protein
MVHVEVILVLADLEVVALVVRVVAVEHKKGYQAAAAAAADILEVVVELLPRVAQAVVAAVAAAVVISLLQRPQISQVLLVAVPHLKRTVP